MRSLSQKHLISRGSEQRLYHLANRYHYRFFRPCLPLLHPPYLFSLNSWSRGTRTAVCELPVPQGRLTNWPCCLFSSFEVFSQTWRYWIDRRWEERTQININNIYLSCPCVHFCLFPVWRAIWCLRSNTGIILTDSPFFSVSACWNPLRTFRPGLSLRWRALILFTDHLMQIVYNNEKSQIKTASCNMIIWLDGVSWVHRFLSFCLLQWMNRRKSLKFMSLYLLSILVSLSFLL